ncbi:MAG: phospholipid carrier-dependent glycosyltransferase, partial [Rhizobacter sp.]|nr:phospholipid carrier-dependent glycosyltransferase [Rhizobacter sp.]
MTSAPTHAARALPIGFSLIPRRSVMLIALCSLAALAAVFAGTGHPLQDLNEGEYARVAEEMLLRGSWIVPTVNGVALLDKPPLVYWIDAIAFAGFGVTPRAARAAPILGALLTLAGVAWMAWRHAPRRTILFAPWVLLSTPIIIVLDRLLLFDLLLTGLLTCAFAAFLEAWRRTRPGPSIRASLVFLALAVLAKGLIALVLYAIVIAIFLALERTPWPRVRALFDPIGAVLFLVLVVPWHAAVQWREPGFAWYYFINEHVLRFLDRRWPHDYHTGPAWYYLPRLAADLFPWVLLLSWPDRMAREAEGHFATVRLLVLWAAVSLVFFSLCGGKGDYYLIVAAPALALLCAIRLAAARLPRWRVALLPAASLAVLGGAALLAIQRSASFVVPPEGPALLALAAVMAIAGIVLAYGARPSLAVGACAAVGLPVSLLFSGVLSANEPASSSKTLAERIAALQPTDVYLYRDFERWSALPTYLGRCVGVVDSHSSDLAFGLSQHPDPARFPDSQTLAAEIGMRRVVVVARDIESAQLEQSALGRALQAVG